MRSAALVAAGRAEPTVVGGEAAEGRVADGESGVAEPAGAMLAGAEAEPQAAAVAIAVESAGENAAMGIVAEETDEGRTAVYFAAAGCGVETGAYSETGLAPSAG